ncbi:Diguanylate cyclase [Rhodovastum atsumiense]|uniref:diguanylate cyclase n=1 Tax=Rhodovastum atsumiense TaxID=504468 RepID=UPI00139F2CCC|nr:diguanylate cyclase [Rhodovastum atsumiense]CAH2603114.1 Diguanylate cyclase [Rhodovastum atsumiense]
MRHLARLQLIVTNLLDESAVGGIVATCHDVTERRTYERELTTFAFTDPLTGLANRACFKERLQQALAAADAGGALDRRAVPRSRQLQVHQRQPRP